MALDKKNNFFQIFQTHLINDERPSEYLDSIKNSTELEEYPFSLLKKLQSTEQSPTHHPEGNVWNHTLLVVDNAAREKIKSTDPVAFMWAALLHDIGKPSTTKIKRGKYTAYGHDTAGAALAKEFLLFFDVSEEIIHHVCTLVRYHMQILFVVNDLPYADMKGMKRDADIKEIALLGLCDRLGRINIDFEKERQNIKQFLRKCGVLEGV